MDRLVQLPHSAVLKSLQLRLEPKRIHPKRELDRQLKAISPRRLPLFRAEKRVEPLRRNQMKCGEARWPMAGLCGFPPIEQKTLDG
jgi:hypothetical protein